MFSCEAKKLVWAGVKISSLMLFNSSEFLVLLLATLTVYCLSVRTGRENFQVSVMFLGSCLFYGWHQPGLLILLAASAVFNALAAIFLARGIGGTSRFWVSLVVGFNVLLLVFFKYADLLGSSVLTFLGEAGGASDAWWSGIPLPVGISFFTFQGISLIMDASRDQDLREMINQKSFGRGLFEMVTYIIFFPQLIAGPIVKARSFLPQYRSVPFKEINFLLAIRFLIIGFFFKMVVADNLKDFTVFLTQPGFGAASGADLLLMLYGYSFQIYADFFGYSTIAVGLALLFGYRLPENFNVPYVSASFSEFWSRWHISLSSWLREYLYFPLGGNRKGHLRTYCNLFIVMLIGGLWHGAGWNYLLWGASHGVVLAIERAFAKKENILAGGAVLKLFKTLVVFNLVTVLWLFFILPDFSSFSNYWQQLFSRGFRVSPNIAFGVFLFSLPVLVQHLWALCRHQEDYFSQVSGLVNMHKSPSLLRNCGLGLMLATIVLNSGTAGEFIYFQF